MVLFAPFPSGAWRLRYVGRLHERQAGQRSRQNIQEPGWYGIGRAD